MDEEEENDEDEEEKDAAGICLKTGAQNEEKEKIRKGGGGIEKDGRGVRTLKRWKGIMKETREERENSRQCGGGIRWRPRRKRKMKMEEVVEVESKIAPGGIFAEAAFPLVGISFYGAINR